MTMKDTFIKLGRTISKHSPAIFTGAGIVGLGATAYLAYKSRDKVEAVVLDIEEKRDNEEEINKIEVAKGIAEAIYLPVTVGALSITAILMSHSIQRKRILTLSGALAVQQARNVWFENKYKQEHGEEAYSKFVTPTESVERIEVDKKGKEKVTTEQVAKEVDKSIGQWYEESEHYVSDDHTYNISMIDSVADKLQTILFARGSLLLNEVREELGFDRIRNGALLGWTTSDSFDIEKHVVNIRNEDTGEMEEKIWVTWSRARYVYDDVDFNGRYSNY